MSAADDAETLELIRSGNLIAAIKRRREATGEDLASAKAYVDAVRAGSTPPSSAPPEVGADDVERRIRTLLQSRGDKIGAIKVLREATGCSLKDAHERVCAIAAELGLHDLAWKPSEATTRVVAFLVLAAVLVLVFLLFRMVR